MVPYSTDQSKVKRFLFERSTAHVKIRQQSKFEMLNFRQLFRFQVLKTN